MNRLSYDQLSECAYRLAHCAHASDPRVRAKRLAIRDEQDRRHNESLARVAAWSTL